MFTNKKIKLMKKELEIQSKLLLDAYEMFKKYPNESTKLDYYTMSAKRNECYRMYKIALGIIDEESF